MRTVLLTAALLGLSTGLAEEALPRNPFWPQGYEGVRYPITLEPRIKPEPPEPLVVHTNRPVRVEQPRKPSADEREEQARKAELAAERAAQAAELAMWTNAIKSLKFGSILCFSATNGEAQSSIMINDRAYSVGELVSADAGDNRFTWQIETISTAKKLKLKRLYYRPIRKNP